MHPVLFSFEVFGRTIPYYSYGSMLALAFIVGAGLACLNGRREGISAEQVFSLSLLILVASLLGSRMLHVLMADSSEARVFSGAGGGFAFYGGLLGGILAALAYCRLKSIPFLRMADTMAPSIALGQAIGRLGCLLAGCCWGRPARAPLPDWLSGAGSWDWPTGLAVTFLDPGTLGRQGIALVPTQLASGVSCFGIFLVLWLMVRPRQSYPGQSLALYLLLYAPVRSFWELFRGDPRGMYFGDLLSTSQLVSIPMFLLGLWLLLRGRTKHPGSVLKPQRTE